MGSIIGGVIGGIGSLFGGSSSKKADQTAAQQSLTGFNYLAGNSANQAAQATGTAAANNGQQTQSAEAQLLGTQPITSQTQNGFNNYLNSTGYDFQKSQGTSALTGSAAARGLLGSGSTAKALTSYGQNLASTTFNNYLGNLSGLNTQQQGTANAGITATGQVGQAGTSGGTSASNATQAGGAAQGNGIATAAGTIGAQSTNVLNTINGMGGGPAANFFGSL